MQDVKEVRVGKRGSQSPQGPRDDLPPRVAAPRQPPTELDNAEEEPQKGQEAERSQFRCRVEQLIVGMLNLHAGISIDDRRTIRDKGEGKVADAHPRLEMIPNQPERSLPHGQAHLEAPCSQIKDARHPCAE